MTPIEIEVLLKVYYLPDATQEIDLTPGSKQAFDRLTASGLIEKDLVNRTYAMTKRGQVHVEALCNLPLPEQVWKSPDVLG